MTGLRIGSPEYCYCGIQIFFTLIVSTLEGKIMGVAVLVKKAVTESHS